METLRVDHLSLVDRCVFQGECLMLGGLFNVMEHLELVFLQKLLEAGVGGEAIFFAKIAFDSV